MIYIHEIDNDGRGMNTWEVNTEGGEYLGSYEHFDIAALQALMLAKEKATTVTIYPIEWYYKQHEEER